MEAMAKFCCISDCHGNLNFEIPKCDCLLIAGDIVGENREVIYINAALCDDNYKLTRKPVVIEL